MLDIKTTRYSAVVTAFLDAYPGTCARLNGRVADEVPANWCTNTRLKELHDFSLTLEGRELLGFHDSPADMWAADEAQPLLEILAATKIAQFSRSRHRRGLLSRLLARGGAP